jgi:hypothetical protein
MSDDGCMALDHWLYLHPQKNRFMSFTYTIKIKFYLLYDSLIIPNTVGTSCLLGNPKYGTLVKTNSCHAGMLIHPSTNLPLSILLRW